MFSFDVDTIFRTFVMGVCAYAALILLLRISGLRTLSKMNAFDFVVTITIGSTFATILLNKDVSLAQGVSAFAVLIGLQYFVTWLSVRAPWVRKIITGEPTLLFHKGQYQSDNMRKARVTIDEIKSAMRVGGSCAPEDVEAVILETNGTFSVMANIKKSRQEIKQSLDNEKTLA